MKRVLLFLLLTATSLHAATIAHYKFENRAPNTPLYELTDSSANGHHGRVLGQELFELTADIPPYPGVTGAYNRVGYLVGEGGLKSFFYRRTFSDPPQFRVVPDTQNPSATVPFTTHDAIELRFPTNPDQLYRIVSCEDLNCLEAKEVFVLGDGAKMSYFERAGSQTRFYTVERY